MLRRSLEKLCNTSRSRCHSRHVACWHAPVGMARAHVSSRGGGRGGGGCVALAAHAEEREGQVRANDES